MKRLACLLLLLFIAIPAFASVNVMTGSLTLRQELFSAQGGPTPLRMQLRYNSFDKISGQVGTGWSHSYEIYLHENSDGSLVLTGGQTKHFYFTDGSGNYVPRIGDHSTLTANADGTYTITFPDGRTYQFDSNKQLSSITDRYGNVLTFDTSVAGQLSVTDPTGRTALIHYNADGRVDYLQDPAGSQFDFTYNANGQLETITYPAPQTGGIRPLWIFNYTVDGFLEYITNPNLQISKYVYSEGKVVRVVAPEGVVDTNGSETANASAYSTSYTYDGSMAPARTSAVLSAATAQTSVTQEDGGQWLYIYDLGNGVLAGKQDPLGNLSEYGWYDSASPYFGQRSYSMKTLKVDGNAVAYQLTSYNSYDNDGNLLDVTTQVRTITYDESGNPVSSVDAPVHRHLSYTYGTYNRPTSITDQIAGTSTAISYVEQADGSEIVTLTAPKINATDPNGPQTVIIYRADGQIASVTDPLGRVVSYAYDASGQMTSVTDPNNIVSSFSDIDALGLAQTLTLTGNDGSTTRTTSVQYDALANLIKITQGAASPLITEFDYDGLGNRTGVIDAELNATLFEHDSKGQVTKISNTLEAGQPEEQVLDTILTFGGAGCPSCSGGSDKLTALTDAKSQTTSFSYDELGRLIKETDAENNVISYTYFADGRPKQKFLGEAETGTLLLAYEYTADGKLTAKKDSAGTSLAGYSYDAKNRLLTASTPDSSLTFGYYDNGWLRTVDNGSYVIEYQYDQLGRRELVQVRQDTTVLHSIDYVYDATTKELKDIISDQAGTFSFDYDAFGRRATLGYPNGIVGNYNYDDVNQMDWLTGVSYTDGGADILNIGYPQHDKVGNRMQRTEDGITTDYSYDDLYRITQAQTGVREENFTYDAVGNRESGPTVKDTPEASYDYNTANQMLEGRKFTYDYDGQGNQTHRYLNAAKTKYWQYSWTPENQLQQADLIKDGQTIRTVSFKYDAFGRRTEKQVTQDTVTTTTAYIYDGEDIILQLDDDGSNTTTTHYAHGPGIDEPLAQTRDGQTRYYHADGLGSIIALTDSAKQVVQKYSYETFGMLTATVPGFNNSYTYTAREWDKELGLYYYRARYYDPMEGQFVSKDQIIRGGAYDGGEVVSFFQYVNAIAASYLYTDNNPTNWIDPGGLAPVKTWRFDLRDHGGPHFQAGTDRYDADSLRPLPHKGVTPPELSKSAKKSLMKSEAYAKYLKWVKGGRLLGAMGLFLDLSGDISRCKEAIENGRSLDEQLRMDLMNEGPYIEAGGMILPNPYYNQGGWL